VPRISARQHPLYILGTDGKLVYIADSLGNKIPDFSNAGYKGGGVSIPYVAIKETVWPRSGRQFGNIQAGN